MERRYEEELTRRIEDALLHGCSHITWPELYRWYGVERFAAGSYRDLNARWLELTAGKRGRLMQIDDHRNGIFIFGEKDPRPIIKD